jgi:hypothetical protein
MRCNTGCNPKFLADQHLMAEARELKMVIGNLRTNDFKIKGKIPKQF